MSTARTKSGSESRSRLPLTWRGRRGRPDPAPDDLVFTSPQGGPLRDSNFRQRHWTTATEKAGLSGLEIHELRHIAASLVINQGGDHKLIQSELVHSSISIAYDVYGHLFPDRLDELAADRQMSRTVDELWKIEENETQTIRFLPS